MEEDLIQINDKVFVLYIQQIERDHIRYRVTNSANQLVEFVAFVFYEDKLSSKKFWTFSLSVNKKSRGYEFGKVTGKTGIESLLIAKEMLKYHIKNCYRFWYDNYFYIWADDSKRFRVYERGLKDLGFTIANNNWGKRYKSGKCLLNILLKS